jgi:hypothetical protein
MLEWTENADVLAILQNLPKICESCSGPSSALPPSPTLPAASRAGRHLSAPKRERALLTR